MAGRRIFRLLTSSPAVRHLSNKESKVVLRCLYIFVQTEEFITTSIRITGPWAEIRTHVLQNVKQRVLRILT
jgi:hypothetical protein